MNKNKYVIGVILTVLVSPLMADDPTRPDIVQAPAKTQSAVKKLHLTMVRMSDKKPSATINGQLLHVGDRIGGYRVSRITAKQVVLKNNKGQLKLNLITKGALRKSS